MKTKIAGYGLEAFFEWEGFVREQQAIYDKVDVVVVPSICNEAFSLTTLEAMMQEKKLIVSNRGAIPELVTDRKTGLIFTAEDPSQLMECMRLYLDRDAVTTEFARLGFEKAMQAFTDDRMAAAYTGIYSSL